MLGCQLGAGLPVPDELPKLDKVKRHHAENQLVGKLDARVIELLHSLLNVFPCLKWKRLRVPDGPKYAEGLLLELTVHAYSPPKRPQVFLGIPLDIFSLIID